MASNSPINPESWEQHETQIRLEKADEFAKLSPEKQDEILAEEKIKFEKAKKEAKETLGFKPFDPEEAKKAAQTSEKEEREKEKALANFEHDLHTPVVSKSEKKEEKASEKPFDEKRFYELFTAATENVEKDKPFNFNSVDLDDFGQTSTHVAHMTRLTDFSQTKPLKPGEILSRLREKKASPANIGVTVEIDMNEDKNNSLGLTNLSFEIPLVELMNGHFIEKISRFTNFVLFAALLHDRKEKEDIVLKDKPVTPVKKPGETKSPTKVDNAINQFAALRVEKNGNLMDNARGAFEQGDRSTITFSCNNGFIWGTFDQQGVPHDPKNLQEALDKTKQDI